MRCNGERGPPHLPRRSLPPSCDFLSASLSPSLFPSFCSPIARAPRSPPSNPLRHALACVNHAYRFSFVGVSEGRSVVAHVFPLPSPFLAPSAPFFLTESPGAVPRHGANPLLKTHTRAVPDSFRTMARILAFLLPPCSLSLSLFLLFCYPHPFLFIPLLVTSYEALDAYSPSRPCTSDASSLLQPPCDAILRSSKMPPTDKETHVEIWKCKSLEFILVCVVLRRFI